MEKSETLCRTVGIRWLREHITVGTRITQLVQYGATLPEPRTYTVVEVRPSAGLVLDGGQGHARYRSPWPTSSLRVEGDVYHKDEGTRYEASYRIETD